ncbi:MAG: dehalogenase [Gracilibacteraceae bacterium]|jgi:FtsH-binding integral membrane protein|nr:dehalogenase [Gracilibacteraceae bacterium]
MGVFLMFIAGMIFLAGVLFVRPKVKTKTAAQNAAVWILYVLWYGITLIGVSFVYINAGVGHVKATSTAIFLFLGLSIVLAVILARVLGLLGVRKTPGSGSAAQES